MPNSHPPRPPRIAILGFDLESNRFAPITVRADFERNAYVVGPAIDRAARAEPAEIHGCIRGFYRAMDRAGPWTPVPLIYAGAEPGGPVDQTFFDEFAVEIDNRLRDARPLDGVYICEHGGAVATGSHDPDGDLFAMVRAAVGPDVPVVATLDLHANISERMVQATDLMVAYRTNPHVDQVARGAEAAAALGEMLAGLRPKAALVRLPLVAPQVTLLTAEGEPYGDLIRLGQSRIGQSGIDRAILSISVVGGFSFADTPKNGMAVLVTARAEAAKAKELADELARAGWADRHRYRRALTGLDEAVRLAGDRGRDPALPALLLADVADNPGGGGRGNTTFILKALVEAGVAGALLGPFFDSPLVEAAFAAGAGAPLDARFNTAEADRFSEPFAAPATVTRLSDGKLVGRYGMVAGQRVDLGRSCLLDLGSPQGGPQVGPWGGVRVVVISRRQQGLSTDCFSHFGLDVAAARTVFVKSRGHFRAGFAHLFGPERVREVDVPGLTSPNLANFDWQYLPRPVYPLDPDTVWPG